MSTPKIYGIVRSTYVKSARWAFEEKGVAYELVQPDGGPTPGDLNHPAYLKRHPFARIPALEHDDHHIYEAAAICSYVDEAFDGPALQPDSPLERARMRQWISVASSYLDPTIMRGYVFPYAFAKDGNVDRERVEAALPACERYTEILDAALEGHDFLAGDQLTIADIMIGPMFWAFGIFPEGKKIMEARPNLNRAVKGWLARPGFQATLSDPRQTSAA